MFRRDFMKLCGIAVASPALLAQRKNAETEQEIEITFPGILYDYKTGKTIELNLRNPAHLTIWSLSECGVHYELCKFLKWGKYCDNNNLQVPDVGKYIEHEYTMYEFLCEMSRLGNAFFVFDNGRFELFYGMPLSTLRGRHAGMAIIDDTYSVENIL